MVTTSEQIVNEFVADRWKSNPFDKLIPMLQEQRDEALQLTLLVIDHVPDGGTFFDLALSYLTEAEFEHLIDVAVDRMPDGPTEAIDSVIGYASLQFPKLLTQHLRSLFEHSPNEGTYYEAWPWRHADEEEIGKLKEIVEQSSDEELRERAWCCLIETRRADCIAFAEQHFPRALDRGNGMTAYTNHVGIDHSEDQPRSLHSEIAHHIVFPAGYIGSERPLWRRIHPTWDLENDDGRTYDFGGELAGSCIGCGDSLHQLIRVEQADVILGTRLPTIALCTCLSCLGWEIPQMFFTHDESGNPSAIIGSGMAKKPQFATRAFPATNISIVQSPPRWNHQDWALSNGRENLNRIGGPPSWIQDAQYPSCPQCKRLMPFVAQLDSEIPTADGGEWLWGSGGICYLFWCDQCSISGNFWQCT